MSDKTPHHERKHNTYLELAMIVVSHLFVFMIIPYVMLTLIQMNYPDIMEGRYQQGVFVIMTLGSMAVITSSIYGYFEKGTKIRFLSGILYVIVSAAWLYFIMGGGSAFLEYRGLEIYIVFYKLLYLAMVGVLLKVILVVIEYFTYYEVEPILSHQES